MFSSNNNELVISKMTKIVATLGPASSSEAMLRKMISKGVDIFRLNFSHGTHGEHQEAIHLIRHIARDMNRPIPILGDLSGPKIRIGEVTGGGVEIVEGELIVLTSEEADGTDKRFQINFEGFHEVAKVKDEVLLDDGNLKICVDRIDGADVICRVMTGGILKPRKGVNLPDTHLPIPALTEKDKKDMAFALRHGVDCLALSFVRRPEDIELAREEMKKIGRMVPIFAKIEMKEALENLWEIIRISNGAMVARGDLGIEIPMEEVPSAQKRIIKIANQLARPVITATQMMESMITARRPTRAEVTDIYNAIHDGTDCIMLSGETSVGAHPDLVVETMHTIAQEAEQNLHWDKSSDWVRDLEDDGRPSTTNVICNSAVSIAERLKVDMIIIPTQTGFSARHISMFRPNVPVFAVSPNVEGVMAATFCWGVLARQMEELIEEEVQKSESDAMVNEVIRTAKRFGIIKPGNRVVVLGGLPIGQSHHTNYVRLVDVT